MKYYSLLIVALLFITSCKKNEFKPNPVPEPAPLTDFLYLPVKDAEWRIHLQNFDVSDQPYCSGYAFTLDTALHYYYTIRATNTDTLMYGYKYYRYMSQLDITYTRKPCETSRRYFQTLFLREDTLEKKVFTFVGRDEVIIDFSVDETGNDAKVSSLWPASYVSGENGIIVNGQKAKSWEVAYKQEKDKKFFYKAYGIGSQIGILHPYLLGFCEPISLDFTYKGQTNHFDFELHP